MSGWRELNRANWDDRAVLHAASPEYPLQSYVDDPDRLSDVVVFDRERLGDLAGVRAIHLQCHLGTDTLSLARLGAETTGLDFSAPALERAADLAARGGARITYLRADVYDAVEVAGAGAYDLVYTGMGALCWLPDVRRWAHVVAGLLRPGGRLFIREGHPVLWSLADRSDLVELAYPYFETAEPMVWDQAETYVETLAPLTATVTHQWNHAGGRARPDDRGRPGRVAVGRPAGAAAGVVHAAGGEGGVGRQAPSGHPAAAHSAWLAALRTVLSSRDLRSAS